MRPTQLNLQMRMENVRDDFIKEMEAFTGRKILYGSMGPSIFGVLDIRNILILREDDSVFLSISRLRLSYSLFSLILGNNLDAFHSVRIDKPIFNFDFVKDADLTERLFTFREQGASISLEKNAKNLYKLLPEKFSFRIWNGEWELSDSFGMLKIYGVKLDASIRQNRLTFNGRWNAQVSFSGNSYTFFAGLSSEVLEVIMAGRISGEYSEELDEGTAMVVIPSLSGNNFRLRTLSFNFFFNSKYLEFRKIYDRSPVSFYITYDFETEKLQCFLEAENFSPSNLITFTGPWRDYNNTLAARISGYAGFEWEKSGGFGLDFDFSGFGPRNTFFERASLKININGNSNEIIIDNFDIYSTFGILIFKGGIDIDPENSDQMVLKSISPYGSFNLTDFRFHGNHGISGELILETNENEIYLFSEKLICGNATFSDFDLLLYREEHGFNFVFSTISQKERESDRFPDDVRISSLSIEGTFDYIPTQIQANMRLDSFVIGDVLSFIEPFVTISAMPAFVRSAADDLSLTTEVFFITDFNHVLYNAPRVVAAYEGFLNVLAAASFSGTDRGIELDTARITWDNGTVELNGYMDFSDPADISFSLGASIKNLNYYFEGMIQDRQNIVIRGSYGIQVLLVADDVGVRTGYARGEMIPIPSGDRIASLNFLFSLFYDSTSYWRMSIDRFDLSGLSTPSASLASITFTGEAGNRGLRIPDLFYDDGRSPLIGEIAFNWDDTFKSGNFLADIYSGNRVEYYALNGVYADKRIRLLFDGQRMQLSRFIPLNAIADGSIELFWESPSSFEAEMQLPSFVIQRQNEAIRLSTVVNFNNDEFLAQQIKIYFSNLEATIPFVKVDRNDSIAETEGRIWGLFSDRHIDISLSANAEFTYADTWFNLFRDFNHLDASLIVHSAAYDDIEAKEPFSFTVICREDTWGLAMDIDGGPRNMLRFRYTPERTGGGIFYAAFSAPSPARGTITGFIDTNKIDALGTDIYVDLGSLWRFIPPNDVINFPSGIVTASLKIAGTILDPEFYGTARGSSVQIMVPQYLSEPIRPVNAVFNFDRYDITFGPVDALVGHGAGKVSGWFRFDQWIPNIFNIDIEVYQDHPVPYDFDLSGVIAKGFVAGNLTLAMENMIFSINGDLIAQDTIISLDASELAALEDRQAFESENSKVSVIADLSIRSGRRVEFFWPTVDFPIIQANANMGTGIHITSDSVAKRFTLNGDVILRSGEIFYLERNFYIREGTLFFRENEVQFDPRISARAELRDRSDAGPVTISMIIDNAPLKSFIPRFVSTPPLSQLEIYTILGQYPQGDGEQRNLATSAVIDSLAQFTVIQRFQREVRDYLGLDMLSMRTQLLQNVVLQATGGLQFSDDNIERSYRLGNYFDNTTVFLGKYFGADLFGEAMLSFRHEENKLDWGGLVLEPELGLEMRNPLFDIRFNVVPLHPENMFIDDVSFSIIWRRSY